MLTGLAAAGVGATLTMGVRVARGLPRNFVTAAITLGIFLVVGVLRWPMIPVVSVAVPLSVALAFVRQTRRAP